MDTYPIIIGTAGHIDHGKTALVKQLTGTDTDRLKEEKARGITVELGFANLTLGGRTFGVVDVPGHERFIKSMVAGAGGLDLVCLVIAADEGIMPQTREHLDICELLGVRRGVVALTKSDLVDDEWIELVSGEIREVLAPSFLRDAPLIPVSAKTGAGLDALREALLAETAELSARPSDGPFRLPLDRVFTMKGFGTVVTGTIVSGSVDAADTVRALPSGAEGKVRGIQVHGSEAERAVAGMRCAINVSGVHRDELSRGDILAKPGEIEPSHLFDARFKYLTTSHRALGPRTRILLHHGTSQTIANLVLIEQAKLEPGQEALVQLRLDAETPIAALPGDRFIARGFTVQKHYGTTLGGGEILAVHARKLRRSASDAAARLQRLARARGDERVAIELLSFGPKGATADELRARLGSSEDDMAASVARLTETGDIAGAGTLLCHAVPLAELDKRAVTLVTEYAAANAEGRGIPREELRGKLSPSVPRAIAELVLTGLVERGAITIDGDHAKPGGDKSRSQKRSPLAQKLFDRFAEWALTPPRPKNIAAEIGEPPGDVKAALDGLIKSGDLVRVKSDLYVHSGAVDELQAKLRAHLEANGQITSQEWKAVTGATRKFSIPLAEYFDAIKFTLRIGDIRKLR